MILSGRRITHAIFEFIEPIHEWEDISSQASGKTKTKKGMACAWVAMKSIMDNSRNARTYKPEGGR